MTAHSTFESGLGPAPISSNPRSEPAGVLAMPAPRSAGVARKLLLAMFGLVLAVLVVRVTLVAYLAERSPERALLIAPSDPVAVANSVEVALRRPKSASPPLAAGPGHTAAPAAKSDGPLPAHKPVVMGIEAELTPAEVAGLRTRVEQALADDPLSARSFRLLGQLADLEGNADKATSLIESATRRSKHESLAVLMMIRRNVDAANWPAAMYHADILMRTRHDLVQAITPVVVRMAETPAAGAVVKRYLADNPIWRAVFLELMLSNVTDARTPLDLYLALKEAGSPPTQQQIAAFLNFLIGHQFHEMAYYTWLQFLTPEQLSGVGPVFNGNFEQLPTGMPFDWVLPRTTEAFVDLARVPGETGNRALRIEFGSGRVQLGDIQQRTQLPGGSYRLTGRLKGEVAGRRGMRVTVSCATRATEKLAETPMFIGQAPDWRPFELAFTVPDTCRSQAVRIIFDARYSAEQFVSGVVWYDDIAITRMPVGG